MNDLVTKALHRAWQLGQTYWQQADSESYSQNKKADETERKFAELLAETRAVLALNAVEAAQGQPVAYWNFKEGFSHCMIERLDEAAKNGPAPLFTKPQQVAV